MQQSSARPKPLDKPSWSDRISTMLVRGRMAEALRELERISTSPQLQLFGDATEERELAILFKVDLLRDLGRLREALAWVCLECEINPTNITAQGMKQELKGLLGYLPPPEPEDEWVVVRKEAQEWEGVAGMRELKAILERDVIQPIRNPAIYERYGLKLPNGILMYGPPGCGKTHIARALSRVVSYGFKEVSPSDLASIYVHGTQEKIRGMFDEAAALAPCILFLDELDAFVPNRGNSDVSFHYAAEVNEFLVQLNKCAEREILVIGATNRIDQIDAAMLRPGRLDKKIFVGPPDPEARAEVIRLYLRDRPVSMRLDAGKVAVATPYYTPAELELVVNEAARLAMETEDEIAENHLMEAVRATPPALDAEKIREYEWQSRR